MRVVKKKKTSKKTTKKTSTQEPSVPVLTAEEQLVILQSRVADLEISLDCKLKYSQTLLQAEAESKLKLAQLEKDLSERERNTTAIACDKVRLYKAKQEHLIHEVSCMEATLVDQHREREILQKRLSDLELEKQTLLNHFDSVLVASRAKHAAIVAEFDDISREIARRISCQAPTISL